MIKFIAFTCCATCEHEKVKESSCHTHKTCDLDNNETDDYLVCGKWKMSEYLKTFTNKVLMMTGLLPKTNGQINGGTSRVEKWRSAWRDFFGNIPPFKNYLVNCIKECLINIIMPGTPTTITTEFQISYEGIAIQDGTIDADKLAESLLGVSNLLEESHNKMHGSNSNILTKVKGSFRGESFVADFITIMTSQDITAFVNTVTILGCAGGTGIPLFKFVIWAKGKLIQIVRKVDDKNVEVNIAGNTDEKYSITVPLYLIELYQDRKIRQYLNKTLSPLQYTGIEKIKFVKNKEDSNPTIIKKEDFPFFTIPEPEITESTREVYLEITNADIGGDSTGWRFKYPDEHDFKAIIKDEKFLKRVKSGDEKFTHGDIIHGKMYESQMQKERLIPKRIIIEVFEIIPREKEEGVSVVKNEE